MRTVLLILLFSLPTQAAPPSPLFTETTLARLTLHLTAHDWQLLQPTRGNPPLPNPNFHPSNFGVTYPIVNISISDDTTRLNDVALRFKGNSSYLASTGSLKRPLKLDFNHYNQAQRYQSLASLNLQNNVLDPSMLRETLSYELFRQANIPAPQTRLAEIFLQIDRADPESLGVYTLVQDIDKHFLKAHFGTAKGLLLKPESVENFRDLGDNFDNYIPYYNPKTPVTPECSRRLIEMSRLITSASDKTFAEQIPDYLALDDFASFLAANVILANMDSLLSTGHNYYLYIHPETGKIHFIPWDLNMSLAGYVRTGTPSDLVMLSIRKPYVGSCRLVRRLLEIESFNTLYREKLAHLNQDFFTPEKIEPHLIQLKAQIAKAAHPTPEPHPATLAPPCPLEEFIPLRHQSIAAQLQNEIEAYEPTFIQGPVSATLPRKQKPPTPKALQKPN